MCLEIDMQPLGSTLARSFGRALDERGRETLPAVVGINRGIEKERMHAAILGDIDEADKAAAILRCDMAETAFKHAPIVS